MQTNASSRFSSGRAIELIASGIPSLDSTLGGGYPVGSIVLIIEDHIGIYSDLFFKTFLSQGVVNDDTLFVASPNTRTSSFFDALPAPIDSPGLDAYEPKNTNEPMVIAWRYSGVNPSSESPKQLSSSQNFSFVKYFPPELLADRKLEYWDPKKVGDRSLIFTELLNSIRTSLIKHSSESLRSGKKSHLRIGINGLGSASWGSNQESITKFLIQLRWVIDKFPACVVVTLPSNLIKKPKIVSRCEQISDIVYRLIAIDTDANPLYKDYNGLLRLHKIRAINSLVSVAAATDDWAFKMLKKRLLVERLTLPPELDTSTQREQVKEPLSCASMKRNLDF